MKQQEGKIMLTYDKEETPETVKNFLELEQYLNDVVAADTYKKYGILIRVHI